MKKLTPDHFKYQPFEDAYAHYRKISFPPGADRDAIRDEYRWLITQSAWWEFRASPDFFKAGELDGRNHRLFGIRVRVVAQGIHDNPVELVKVV